MTSALDSIRIPRSSSRCQMSRTRSGGSPSSPVIWTSRSVPPATGRYRSAPSRLYASASERGEATGGSTGIGSGGVVARPAALLRNERDRLDDLGIAGAAAQVPGDRHPDLLVV